MTTTEQIVWAHRVDKDRARGLQAGRDAARLRRPAAGLRRHGAVLDPHVQPDHRRRRDLPAPGGDRQRSLRVHRQARTTTSRRRSAAQFARAARHREAVLRDARRRHLPFLLSRAGPGAAGPVHSRRRLAQPRLRRVRRGRHRRRLDDARLRLVDGLHLLHAREGSAASCSRGRLQPWVSGKDIVLELLRRWGAKQSQGMSVEFVDARPAAADRVSRNTIANMMAEAEALNGIFAPDDDHATRGIARRASTDLPYPPIAPGADARVRDRRDARSRRRARR